MTQVDCSDLLGHKGHKNDLLQQGRNLVSRMEYYNKLNQPYQNWIFIINRIDDPMQLLFGLFDSILSPQPPKAHKAKEQLSILLYWANSNKHRLEEESLKRATAYFSRNNYSLAKEVKKQIVAGKTTSQYQIQHYARLTKWIARAFQDLSLPRTVTAPLRRVSALWEQIAKKAENPAQVTRWSGTDSNRLTATKQPEQHVRV